MAHFVFESLVISAMVFPLSPMSLPSMKEGTLTLVSIVGPGNNNYDRMTNKH